MSAEEVKMVDREEDCLSRVVVNDINIWNASIAHPLTMREYDVAVYDSERGSFQEFQKVGNEFRFQVQNGLRYCF